MRGRNFLFVLLLNGLSANAESRVLQEPAYCGPERFLSSELQVPGSASVQRLRAFRVGQTTLAGMAIGLSQALDVQKVAETFSATPEEKFCTWYLNSGNEEAEKLFHHIYLDSPLQMTPAGAAAKYRELLESFFTGSQSGANFISCLENQKYLAFGCNGQSHRGPAVFGMLLTFSGCSPESAEQIVNQLWGLNGVDVKVRLAILNEAFELGNEHPDLRARLQDFFDF
ncbi:MAG TPA: hypothetical protein DCS07_12000 [Bdellovibrionales bacterium]|nr:MAG: hypothetical protein A2Z97_10640 [Bdellovibrionales bacterium GWB1_52_6]OFZ02574.1 MAG: hypothetical protein A2X97_07910 [Bdellovibrionales bacterium GWA1_52_35]OFZ39486.1 MAG: hypothetical protein A2070_12650 [Bdellovibrionales bacterium GWC1_52_8]HAR43332.1 hypothetical protein [Bdellovibrionales bacterium]HCM41425.1 hypothetical protein [Bdellovibrionales bacterium]